MRVPVALFRTFTDSYERRLPRLPQAPSLGGISGDHDTDGPLEYLVAPATDGEFNTTRLRLIPIACWRVDDVRFRFDSFSPL